MEINLATGLTLWFTVGLVLVAIFHLLYMRQKDDSDIESAANQVRGAMSLLPSPLFKAIAVMLVIMLWPYFLYVFMTK